MTSPRTTPRLSRPVAMRFGVAAAAAVLGAWLAIGHGIVLP